MNYDKKLIDEIKDMITERQSTIAAAESVTAGHLQAALSLATEASAYFQGGITCYNLGQKTRHLNIEPIIAQQSNCIHRKIAADMAQEVCKLFLSNFGIGITGYATIIPEIEQEGLFAFVAIAEDGKLIVEKRLTSSKDQSLDVQVDYTLQVLHLLHEYLRGADNNQAHSS